MTEQETECPCPPEVTCFGVYALLHVIWALGYRFPLWLGPLKIRSPFGGDGITSTTEPAVRNVDCRLLPTQS